MDHFSVLIGLFTLLSLGRTSADVRRYVVPKLPAMTVAATEFLPPETNIPASFYPQAPLGNWTAPWDETCEEASILLVANSYYNYNWTKEQFGSQILKMIDWEKQHLGVYIDTNTAQNAEILGDYLHLKTVIHLDPSFIEIKKILADGHMIIGSFAGKELGNPNFINGGPRYHVMVLKGYTANGNIIVDDVGTNKGANYIYDWSTLYNSLHDLSSPIELGAKKIIEVLPPVSGF
jgi:hypothetical protein